MCIIVCFKIKVHVDTKKKFFKTTIRVPSKSNNRNQVKKLKCYKHNNIKPKYFSNNSLNSSDINNNKIKIKKPDVY